MYIPKDKIQYNQYTIGNKYQLSNGDIYVGYYHILFNNRKFTGKGPIPSSQEIFDIQPQSSTYDLIVKNNDVKQLKKYISISLFRPKPTPTDYNNGFMVRYFAKSKLKGITEISQDVYYDILNMKGKYDPYLNTVIKLNWKITGDIISINKKVLESKEKEMKGISNYLLSLDEFSK